MARRNDYGKYILSAGEIGAYTVCPEAWRLAVVERVKTASANDEKQQQRVQKGNELHREWAQNVDEAVYLTRHVKVIIALVLLCIAAFLLNQM
jgi:hypothetical protein